MVRYHYALVDDLISREDFDKKIEEKAKECGNLVDETAAALLVVRDLGREHVSISKLYKKSSLFCFFGKILDITKPKEFDKQDGSKGFVTRMTVGDKTGHTTLVFWDEQAMAISETFSLGECIEVIGKAGRSAKEIQPLNMRKSTVMIECSREPGSIKPPERRSVDLVVLVCNPVHEYTKRDGTPGSMISGLAGTADGVFKFTCFDPNLFSDMSTGSAIHVDSAYEKEGDYNSKEFIIDNQCVLTSIEAIPEIPFCPYNTIQVDTLVSVRGIITKVRPAKKFIRRDGSESYVRNITISELDSDNNSKTTLPVVLWDDAGRNAWLAREHVEIFFALAKIGREGEIEISLGKGGLIRPKFEKCSEFVDLVGTVLHTDEGNVLDCGTGSYLLSSPHPHGAILAARACISGARLFSESEKLITYSLDEVKNRVTLFLQETE